MSTAAAIVRATTLNMVWCMHGQHESLLEAFNLIRPSGLIGEIQKNSKGIVRIHSSLVEDRLSLSRALYLRDQMGDEPTIFCFQTTTDDYGENSDLIDLYTSPVAMCTHHKNCITPLGVMVFTGTSCRAYVMNVRKNNDVNQDFVDTTYIMRQIEIMTMPTYVNDAIASVAHELIELFNTRGQRPV